MANFTFPTGNTGAQPTPTLTSLVLLSDGTNSGEATVQSLLNLGSNYTTPTFTGLVTNNAAVVGHAIVVTTGTSYAVLATDQYIIVNKTTGSATSITLPASPTAGRYLMIKDGKGDAATNNITISPASGNIDAGTSLVLNTAYAAVNLLYNGTSWSIF
jgi:hypothetical protein